MAKINLLPWRDGLRQQKQKDFVTSIGLAVVVTCLLFSLGYLYIENMKEHQQRRNKMVKDEILIVDKKITEIKDIEQKKSQLLTKIEVIQQLQESRPQIVHLFEELSISTPEGVFLNKFVQTGKDLAFTGSAKSNARVSAYMRGIDNSLWLESPLLKEIKGKNKEKNGQYNKFSMLAKQKGSQPVKSSGKK
ncbi:MAG: PilN domain-containing protein [Methylococcales bacterium]|nr:PilN domain-containing protein [Methylococcales bacterium]